MQPTNVADPDYFHRVVDCQWACPAHTPVPEYIRAIAEERYADAYMINWNSNQFPGILGRTCDRPCEPACRRGRVEEEPVAICRLKRVAADNKGDVLARMPAPATHRNGKRVACIGGGAASLTVARDLAPLGYEVVVFDENAKAGGFIRSQIPRFRLPEEVIDEEVGYVARLGPQMAMGVRVDSLAEVLADFDAVFVGTGAPRGRDLKVPGRAEAAEHVHVGIDWLASVSFGHVTEIGRRVIVLGGGNTAMDCCRTARRLGGEEVTVVVRSGFDEMKASPWEKEDAQHEGIPIVNFLNPKEVLHDGEGRVTGVVFEKTGWSTGADGRRKLGPTGEPDVTIACDDVLVAIGQENAFPWIERELLDWDEWGLPVLDPVTFQASHPKVFFGGDAAFGPKNIIWAVAHGHEAAVSIDLFCRGEDVRQRPPTRMEISSQKMGIHEWSYDNDVSNDRRYKVPSLPAEQAIAHITAEVELGYDRQLAFAEAQRCFNCDVQTVFSEPLCIECDACVDICPTDCITFTVNGEEEDLRTRLKAPAPLLFEPLYVSGDLPTGRVMVKDENVCLHCGLCAERCPTGAWDMQKSLIETTKAGRGCGR